MDSTTDPGLVYVIDDDNPMRRALAEICAHDGLAFEGYESAEMFLRRYVDRGPACIVSDVRMPGITGLQMLERLEELGIHHPVILLSGYSDLQTAVSGFRHGAIDFFEKPVSGTVLLGRIHEAIQRDREARRSHDLRRDTLRHMQNLSPRERQVMAMLFDGQPNKAIAHELHLSEKTIAAHRAHILEKMSVDSLPALIRTLMAAHIEPQPEPATSAA